MRYQGRKTIVCAEIIQSSPGTSRNGEAPLSGSCRHTLAEALNIKLRDRRVIARPPARVAATGSDALAELILRRKGGRHRDR